MDIKIVEDHAVTIANGIFGDINTKLKVKKMIMDLVAVSCHQYVNDPQFKKEIDAYLTLYVSK
jgi:hypothetical protein